MNPDFVDEKAPFRQEVDSMGTVLVPARVYYGASTQRARDNFPISGLRMPTAFIRALALVKHCAAQANGRLGLLSPEVADAISRASLQVADGLFSEEFVVDVFQTGSGTSTNMNMNEVVARRARELAGLSLEDRTSIHPNDHVNLGQSSNDVVPTALHMSAQQEILERLIPALELLEKSLSKKAKQLKKTVKTGRTHLQDATPVTFGQVFGGYAEQVREARLQVLSSTRKLQRVALGGTAVGTGLNAHPDFARTVLRELSTRYGYQVRETKNHFRSQSSIDDVVTVSGALRNAALAILKVADDIRWMSCGPRAGFGELTLPAVQPGSSIMPGKVNPVIIESLRMVCIQVQSNDHSIALSAQSDNFELCVMLPLVTYNLLQSVSILSKGCENFALKCIDGIEATDKGPADVHFGLGLATALVPAIGYDEAARLAKLAASSGESVLEVARKYTELSEARLRSLLDPFKMTKKPRR